jgi:hypothetical protein
MLGLVVLIAGFATLSSFFDRVTLYSDAVEHRSIWSTSWLPFGEIQGRREYVANRGRLGKVPRLCIVPKDKSLPVLDFARSYNFDDAFWEWLNSLPNLNEVDERSNLARV